ncbi:MAG: reverse transcriptase domain-containing protein [Anaerolineales bacterium]|nr:reverse transcriptase domain-containing protein [Anaerolineales bacterium]
MSDPIIQMQDTFSSPSAPSCSSSVSTPSTPPTSPAGSPKSTADKLELLIKLLMQDPPSQKADPNKEVKKLLPTLPLFDPAAKSIFDHLDDIDWLVRPFDLGDKAFNECLVQSLRNVPQRMEIARQVENLCRADARKVVIKRLSSPGFRLKMEAELLTARPKPGESLESFLRTFAQMVERSNTDLADARLPMILAAALTPSPTMGAMAGLVVTMEKSFATLHTKLVDLFGNIIPFPKPVTVAALQPSPSSASTMAPLRGPLTPEERLRRREKGLCLYCGKSGHMARECPSAPPCTRCHQRGHPAHRCIVTEIKASTDYSLASTLQSSENLKVKVELGGFLQTQALVDTGAEPVALCQAEVAATLIEAQAATPVAIMPMTIGTADAQHACEITSAIRTSIVVEDHEPVPIILGIAPQLSSPVILGVPFLQDNTVSIKFLPGAPPSVRMGHLEAPMETNRVNSTIAACSVSNLPALLSEFSQLFDANRADVLPPHRGHFDLDIEVIDPDRPIADSRLFQLADQEHALLKTYIEEMLKKGFIRQSSSASGAGVFFIKKKDGSSRLCVDYRLLNERTRRNRYPLPLFPSILDQIKRSGASVFSKLDLKAGYHLLRVAPGFEHLTAFKTLFGLFEYRVVPFGLTNAPAKFQGWMNSILGDLPDVVVYIDDILIFSQEEKGHLATLREVFSRLHLHGLVLNQKKCSFLQETIEFLGVKINRHGTSMEECKISTIREWRFPSTKKGMQGFLGFCNFYRNFIKDFARIAQPLYDATTFPTILKSPQLVEAFESLKESFGRDVQLFFPQPDREFVITGDASDFALGVTLSQVEYDPDPAPPLPAQRFPIAFFSRKLTMAESKLDTLDKELLPLIEALVQWRAWLISAKLPIRYYTDHKNLDNFTSSRKLSKKLARWLDFLGDFQVKVLFTPRSTLIAEDALSKREEFRPSAEEVHRLLHRPMFHPVVQDGVTVALKPAKEVPVVASIHSNPIDAVSLWKTLLKECRSTEDGKLMVTDTALQRKILHLRHDSPIAGHPGRRKTIARIRELFCWPRLNETVTQYVDSCATCQLTKNRKAKKRGLLIPIPASISTWQDLSMDFITGFPMAQGANAILVIVDRFSKMAHFIPCLKTYNARNVAHMLIENVIRLHGIPQTIISDRDKVLTSEFWQEIAKYLGFKPHMTTARHPEADGQTERTNQTLEQFIRSTCSASGLDWPNWLPVIEFAYNSAQHESTGFSPFQLVYGKNPVADFPQRNTERMANPDARILADQLKEIHAVAAENLLAARARMKRYADVKRKDVELPPIGQLVLLNRKELPSRLAKTKMDRPWVGPFKVLKTYPSSLTVKLQLPSDLRIHPNFHISQVTPFTSRDNQPTPSSDIRSLSPEPAYQTSNSQEIIHQRLFHRRTQFLIRNRAGSSESDRWVYRENVPAALISQWESQREGTSLPTSLQDNYTFDANPTSLPSPPLPTPAANNTQNSTSSLPAFPIDAFRRFLADNNPPTGIATPPPLLTPFIPEITQTAATRLDNGDQMTEDFLENNFSPAVEPEIPIVTFSSPPIRRSERLRRANLNSILAGRMHSVTISPHGNYSEKHF